MSNHQIETLGVVGAGELGRLFVPKYLAPPHAEVAMYDHLEGIRYPKGVKVANSVAELLDNCDAIVLAVPLPSYEELIPEVVEGIQEDALVVDVTTSKLPATHIFRYAGLLERGNYVLSHPRFAKGSTHKGHRSLRGTVINVTDHEGAKAEELISSWRRRGSFVDTDLDAFEHDLLMRSQHLSFYEAEVGLSVSQLFCDLIAEDAPTPSSVRFIKFLRSMSHHSPALRKTVLTDNPLAHSSRFELLGAAVEVNHEIEVSPFPYGDGMSPEDLQIQRERFIDLIDRSYHMVDMMFSTAFRLTDGLIEIDSRLNTPDSSLEADEAVIEARIRAAEDLGHGSEFLEGIYRSVYREVVRRRAEYRGEHKPSGLPILGTGQRVAGSGLLGAS